LTSIGFLRNAWYFLLVIEDSVCDTEARSEAQFVRTFENAIDPWHFDTAQGRERFVRIVQMLDRVSAAKRFEHALEIGCAEGAFTEYLVDRCGSLTALDMAQLALERARQRRNWPTSVNFRQWNLRQDSIPGGFELIVAMDVLSTIFDQPS
jgi:2-polyprenyl-3-methyl-5-hydroxy-6-metoxy-1,4-benzoquinol methylase